MQHLKYSYKKSILFLILTLTKKVLHFIYAKYFYTQQKSLSFCSVNKNKIVVKKNNEKIILVERRC